MSTFYQSPTTMVRMSIRPARLDDLPRLGAIYGHYVEHSAATFDLEPRDEAALRAWFDAYPGGPHRLVVLETDEGIQGYASSGRFKTRPAYDISVEISVYLAPDARGHRYGSRLLEHLLDVLPGEGLHRAYAGVALPNPASCALFESHGFTRVGLFSEVGYKHGRYWDVAWYERPL